MAQYYGGSDRPSFSQLRPPRSRTTAPETEAARANPLSNPQYGSRNNQGVYPWWVPRGSGTPLYPRNPNDFYQWFQDMARNNRADHPRGTYFNHIQGTRMPPVYRQNLPGMFGTSQLAAMMRDPYNFGISDAPLQQALKDSEEAYQVAEQRNRGARLSSGAGFGGVAQKQARGTEVARASNIADAMRDYQQYKQEIGDRRIEQTLMNWLQLYNQGVGLSQAGPQQTSGDGGGGVDPYLLLALGTSLICWVAREIYGEDDPRWRKARKYVLEQASPEFVQWYGVNGRALAENVKGNDTLKKALKPHFDRFVEAA